MADDLATLSLRLSNSQAISDAKATGAAFEDMGIKGEAAQKKLVAFTNPVTEAVKKQAVTVEQARVAWATSGGDMHKFALELERMANAANPVSPALKQITDSTRKMTLAQIEAIAINEKMSAGAVQHKLTLGRLGNQFESLVAQIAGVHPVVGKLASVMGDFAVGSVLTVGILGGLALLAVAYDKITESAREARKQQDDLTASYVAQARAVEAATLAGRDNLKLMAELNLESVKSESPRGWKSLVLGALFGAPTGITLGSDADAHGKRVADAQTRVDQTTADWIKAWKDAYDEDGRNRQTALDKAETAAKKAQDDLMRYNESMARTYGSSPFSMTSAQRADWLASQRGRGMSDTERAGVTSLFNVSTPSFSMPSVGLDDGLTPLQVAQLRLIKSFDAVGTSAISLANRLANGRESVATGLANWGLSHVEKTADAAAHWDFDKGVIGTGMKAGATDAIGSALMQFSPANLTYRAVSSGLDYIVKGFTDLALGMLDGGAKAKEYARALKQQRDEYAAAIAQFKHDDLAAALAQNMATADQLLKQWQDSLGGVGGIIQIIQSGGAAGAIQSRDEIAKQEAKNAEIIRRQAQYGQEDLAVRNLRATGQGSQADMQAFQNQQAREMQAAIDANRDATYLSYLATVQNNELIAFQNGLLSTAIRNSPTGGYGIEGYLGRFATPAGPPPGWPTDGGPGTGGPDNPRGGVPPLGGGGGQRPAGTSPLTVQLVVDGRVLTQVVVKDLDQHGAATNGAATSRSAALDTYRV